MKILIQNVEKQSLKDKEIGELRSKLSQLEKTLISKDGELQLFN
jgi:hypothetical protein